MRNSYLGRSSRFSNTWGRNGGFYAGSAACFFVNDPLCLIYADSPYLQETRTGGKLYQHEMTPEDHATFLEALDQHTGAVVLSGYLHPLYYERLAHWTHVTALAVAELGNKQGEVLWLNRHAAKAQQLSLFAV